MIRRAVAVVVAAAAVGALLAAVRPRPAVRPADVTTAPPAPAQVRRVSERPPARSGGRARTATGEAVATPFSVVQVRVTVTGRRLTRVETVALSGENERTRVLNDRAEPLLRERALRAGSAKVDVVTGATYTSESYLQSLQSALDRARRR